MTPAVVSQHRRQLLMVVSFWAIPTARFTALVQKKNRKNSHRSQRSPNYICVFLCDCVANRLRPCPRALQKLKLVVTSLVTIHPFQRGRRTSWIPFARPWTRRRPTCRLACTYTFHFAVSGASSVISRCSRIRTPARSSVIWLHCR